MTDEEVTDINTLSAVTEDSYLIVDSKEGCGHRIQLYGREKETKALVELLTTYLDDNERRKLGNQVVAVHGESGVGKSSLLESFRDYVFTHGGIMAVTKLDQVSLGDTSTPFFDVLGAIGDVCDIVSGLEEKHEIETELKRQLGGDWFMLRQLVPSLPGRVSEGAGWKPVPMTGFYDTVKRTSAKFFETITQFRPLVLFFDDLQWGDAMSLKMIADLACSKTLNTVFVLGFRDGYDTLSYIVDSFVDQVSFMDLHLTILDRMNTGALMRGVLSADTVGGMGRSATEEAAIEELTDLIYEKTLGNPFYVLQFLNLLQEKGLLIFSMERQLWEWDNLPTIALLNACSNVLQLIAVRLEHISEDLRKLLVLASHLGFEFDYDILKLVVSSETGIKSSILLGSPERVDELIEEAKANLLLLQSGSVKLCFTHDQVQLYFYQQVKEGRAKSLLHLEIGRRLSPSCFTGIDAILLLTADNMCAGKECILDETEKGELAMINQEAAKRSLAKSMYPSAAHYLRESIELLGGDSLWDLDYYLSLELHNNLARALCNSGENEKAQQIVEKILEKAKSYVDKLPAFHARVRSLGMEGKYKELCRTSFDILNELGEGLPANPNPFMVLFEIIKTKLMLFGKSDEDLLGMPKMSDPIKVACIELMCENIAPLYMLGHDEVGLLNTLRMLQLSLKYGHCRGTPIVIGSFGGVESALFKNFVGGERLGRLSLRMTEEFNLPESVGICLMVATTFTLPWRSSMRSSTEAFAASARECFKSGEMFFGLLSLGSSVTQMMFSGPQLQAMERDTKLILKQIMEFSSKGSVLLFTRICLQACLNLMGKDGAPRLHLNGEAITEAEVFEEDKHNKGSVAILSLHNAKLLLACHFHSFETAVASIEALEQEEVRFVSNAKAFIPYKFHTALVQIDLASIAIKKRENIRKVKRTVQWMKKAEELGCSDITPLRLIVEAEYQSYEDKPRATMYENAIEECEPRDFAMYASIACERAGVAFQSLDRDLSISYFRRAIEYNTEWGAQAKVDWIRETYLDVDHDKAAMEVVLDMGIGAANDEASHAVSTITSPTATTSSSEG